MIRRSRERVPTHTIRRDLEKYRRRAIELGAIDAKIIKGADVVIDERVRAKCPYPKSRWYGTNVHCPPHSINLDEARRIVERYRHGVFFKLDVPPHIIAGKRARDRRSRLRFGFKRYEITSKIESEAFYDGYHLALGFAGGPCKQYFCPNLECSALTLGQPCRQPLKARESMEGFGMDAFVMAARMGWEIYPVGESISPSEVPCGTYLGLILIC